MRKAEIKAALVADITCEMLRTRAHIAELDRRLEELLANDPAARTMPGMGVVFTAEFLAEVGDLGRFVSADALAAAAGVAPVLRACSAFSCISHHERSEDFYR